MPLPGRAAGGIEEEAMHQTLGAERSARERRLPIRPIARETVQDRVYRQIRELILNGDIEPGQTVTIQSLSDAFQVSAMPVREALRRLLAEQALTVVSGRSVGIPTLTHDRLEDLHRVRREIEPLAASWSVTNVSAAELRRLGEMVDRMQLAAGQKDGRRFVPTNHDFHFTIYRAAGSTTLLTIIESLWLQIGPYFHVLRASDNWHAANSAHRAILEALRAQNGVAAAQALRADIDEAAATLRTLLR
jgi:DNA-binding GntR family transcriptional regulator